MGHPEPFQFRKNATARSRRFVPARRRRSSKFYSSSGKVGSRRPFFFAGLVVEDLLELNVPALKEPFFSAS